jgi:hypothetical protein
MDERPGCAETRDLLPELAAGVAAGDERARALRHLSGCADCRRELDAMSAVADELLVLTPPVEPPAGFESAVLARISPVRRRWPWRRVARLAVTVVLAAAVGIVAGAAAAMRATADDRRVAASYRRTLQVADGRYLAVRRLNTPDTTTVGRVFAYQGNPSWVFVVLRQGTAPSYEVHLVTRDGRDRVIGEVGVTGGEGSWGVVIDVDVPEIAEVRLTTPGAPPLTAVFR